MRAYSYFGSWLLLGGVALACSGTSFSSGGGEGGSGATGDTSGEGANAGVVNRAGSSSGGSQTGTAGTASGGTDTGGTNPGGADTGGIGTGTAGDVSVGGDVVVAGSTSIGGGSAGTASTGGSAGTSGGPPVDEVCPKTQPSSGGLCKDGLSCSYGADLRVDCRTMASCTGGKWALSKTTCPDVRSCQNVKPGDACAADMPECRLDNQLCACTNCLNGGVCGGNYQWVCAGSNTPGCGDIPPNLGQACMSALKCSYGSCALNSNVTASCENGTWSWQKTPCLQ